MARVYQWTEDEDDIAPNAITVGISTDTRMLTIAGLTFGEIKAVVFWPDWHGQGKHLKADLEGPMPVIAALDRAQVLHRQYGFARVVIWLQHKELWDEHWGKLAPEPGL